MASNNISVSDQSQSNNQDESSSDSPLSLLQEALRSHSQVLVNVRNNHKVIGRLRAFDKHFNVILQDAVDMHVVKAKSKDSDGNVSVEPKIESRKIDKLFIRGDSIVSILPNPSS